MGYNYYSEYPTHKDRTLTVFTVNAYNLQKLNSQCTQERTFRKKQFVKHYPGIQISEAKSYNSN